MERNCPYIGVTGFMEKREVESFLTAVSRPFFTAFPTSFPTRELMIGVLASQKTLLGQSHKRPNRYPSMERLGDIFVSHPAVLNLVHYNSKDMTTLVEQLREITYLAGPRLHGFQLNMAWPIPEILAEIKADLKKTIVLQIGGHALELVDHSPKRLHNRLFRYGCIGSVDHVLLDASGGLGRLLEPDRLRDYLSVLQDLPFSFGVAGGLSPTTLSQLEPLIEEFPRLSIDAEGRLRDKDDNLDLVKAEQYVLEALRIFSFKK